MSDKWRATGDTSAPPLAPATVRPTVINPLLSAAVANLTLDDFTHNAMLLPAASPFMPVCAMPPAPNPAATPPTATGGHYGQADAQQQQQQLVAEGSHPPSVVFAGPGATAVTSLPLNTDAFSEISLDYDESGTAQPLPAQSAAVAALSQLPSVASTVFSSFSNIISGITAIDPAPAAVSAPPAQHYQPHQAPANRFEADASLFQPGLAAAGVNFLQQPPSQLPFGPPPPSVAAAPPVIQAPPRLYSPHDAASLASAETGRPPSAQFPPPVGPNANNTYRLHQKRKIYAPLPGLNTTAAAEIPSVGDRPPSVAPGSSQFPPHQQQYQAPVVQQEQPPPQPQSFSFSSIIQKVPLLEKFQQLAVSPAPSHSEPSAPTVPSAYNTQFVTHSEHLQPFVPAASEPPQVFIPSVPSQIAPIAEQQLLRQTTTPFSVLSTASTPFAQPPPPASIYQPASEPQLPPTNSYHQSAHQLPPPTGAAGHLPPSGSAPPASSYRLKGKPLYKTPNTYGTVATPALFQPSEANAIAALPPAQLYNPLESSGVPTTHSYVTGPTQPSQPIAPTVPAELSAVSDHTTPVAVFNLIGTEPTIATPVPAAAVPFVPEQSSTNNAVATTGTFFVPTSSSASIEPTFITAFQPAPVDQQHVWQPPASFFNPTSQYSSEVAPATSSIFDAPAAPITQHSWNPVAVPNPVSIFNPIESNASLVAPASSAPFVPTVAAQTASIFYPSAPVISSTEQIDASVPVSIIEPPIQSSNVFIVASAPTQTLTPATSTEQTVVSSTSVDWYPAAPAIPTIDAPTPVSLFNLPTLTSAPTVATPPTFPSEIQAEESNQIHSSNVAQTPATIFNPFASSEPIVNIAPQSSDLYAPPPSASPSVVDAPLQPVVNFFAQNQSQSNDSNLFQPPTDQVNWFNPSSNQQETDELQNTKQNTIYDPQETTESVAYPTQFFNQTTGNATQFNITDSHNPFQLPTPSLSSNEPCAAQQITPTVDLSTINPLNFFEEPPVNRPDTSFDKYIALEQQTTSSFIEPSSNADLPVANAELPDLVAPGTYTETDATIPEPAVTSATIVASDVNANQPSIIAPFAIPSAPAATDFFQTPIAPAALANPLASFFDSPSTAAANNNTNWFNPIPTSQTLANSTNQTHSTPIHKPQPTDPVHFFNQSTSQPISAPPAPIAASAVVVAAAPNNSASLDIVNNSHIANFFNNPPPLPDDARQQQLDLVKDCNRNYQAAVAATGTGTGNANGGGGGGGASVISSGGHPPCVPHRRLGEIAHFDLFGASGAGSGSGGGAIAAGEETRSFASSVAVEPASSVQSELSEYAASAAGQQLAAVGGAAAVGEEEDTEVQRFLETSIVSAASPIDDPHSEREFTDTEAFRAIYWSAESAEDYYPDQLDASEMAAAATNTGNIAYRPVATHWFYNLAGLNEADTPQTPGSETAATNEPPPATGAPNPPASTTTKSQWMPFSASDSVRLQRAADSGQAVCTTNGGRFDVSLPLRRREPVYWKAAAADEVRRCSWFWKGSDSRLVPYDEQMAAQLEAEYRLAAEQGKWNRRIGLPGGDTVVLHGPNVMVQFNKAQTPDSWTAESLAAAGGVPPAAQQTSHRPRIVRRGLEDWTIEEGESEQVDHLMFMVHGIGAACDLKFRTVEQVVEEFRSSAHQLVQSHFRHSIEAGRVGRIEVLPISWHSELHSEESGIDEKLRAITLASIPKLRTFTNSTLLDILFYTSPVFCQQIIDAVANSINRKYQLYCERNPRFGGHVSVAGHSLGSVIVFDLLQNQRPEEEEEREQQQQPIAVKRDCIVGQAGTGQQSILYPQLVFRPRMFFAFGSPIGMFVTVRGIHSLGRDYKLPTCPGFYNIFHPYDPVAYRIEALINADLAGLPPVLIPHHKGRKRMHLELRETIQRVGNDIKQRVVETFRSTMNRVYNLSPITLQKNLEQPDDLQQEVDEVLEREKQMALDAVESVTSSRSSTSGDMDETAALGIGASVTARDAALGALNGGRRVDYVLQEAPLEFFNEYLFALTSHVCYWESNDTTLFIAKEIYAAMGILTDHKQPQPQTTMLVPSADS